MGRRLVKALENEVNKIHDAKLQKDVKKLLLACCDYTVDMGASSTGAYHPSFSNGTGGLVRHIKAVCKNVETIMKMIPAYDDTNEWDIPYAAAILHDCMKYTEYDQKYTHENHPNLMAAKIREFGYERIAQCVETHMSRFNTCKHSNDVMPVPTKMEHMIVAISDMISAQKYVNIRFDESNNIVNWD
jgi:23S rRNA maturation-related 3'-5' exoribonuclease YhaM